MTSGLRDFGFTFGSKIIILIASIGTQSILAWILGPGPRGSYAVCILFSIVLNLAFVIGTDFASVYFISSKKISLSETVLIVTLVGGFTSLLAIVAGLLIMRLPFAFLENASTQEFHLALILVPINAFSNAYTRIFTALESFKIFAFLSVSTGLVNLIFTFIFLYSYSLSVEGALYANIVSSGLSIIVALFILVTKFNLRFVKTSLKNFFDIISYEFRHYVGKVSNEVNYRAGEILLALFATKEQIGYFSLAVLITSRVNIIPDSLNPVLMPKIAFNKTGAERLVAQGARITGIICAAMLLVLVIFAQEIVSIFFSPSFLPSVLLIRIMAIGLLVRSACKVFIPYLLGTNHPGLVSVAIIVGIPLNLGLLLLLLPAMGLPGAAIAMISGYIASSVILMYGFSRISGLSTLKIWRFNRQDFVFLADAIKKYIKK